MEEKQDVFAMVSKRSARMFAEDENGHAVLELEVKTFNKRWSRGSDSLSVGLGDSMSTAASSRSSSEVSSLSLGSERLGVDLGMDLTDVLGHEGEAALRETLGGGERADLNKESLAGMGDAPLNFGVVVPGVYRSSFPLAANYGFVEGLHLKTIVTLVDKGPLESYDSFIAKNGIAHHVFAMKGTKKESIPIGTMKAILRLVLDRQHHPLLIHCNHGKHRTGCVVAVVRKITGWQDEAIVQEYKAYADSKVRDCDVQYISDFQITSLSNLFVAPRPDLGLRAKGFLRATAFSLVLVLVWMLSGTKLGRQERRRNTDM